MTGRTEEKWSRLIRTVLAHQGRSLRQEHPQGEPTPLCPPSPLFLRCHRASDWEQHYRNHFASGCVYCGRQLRIAARLEEQLAAGLFDPDAEPLPSLDAPRQTPRLVFLLVRSRQAGMWGRRGDPAALAAVPAVELRWHLQPAAPDCVDTEDGPAFRLPEQAARESYHLPEGAGVDLHLDLLLEPGPEADTFVPVLEASPGPHRGKEPLRFLLRFAEDCVREFVVRPHALLDRVYLRSDPVEPIPSALVQEWKPGEPALFADFPTL